MEFKQRQEGAIYPMNIQPGDLLAAIDETATLYAKRYGRMPTACLVSIRDVINGELPSVSGMTIEASPSVLPGKIHMFSDKPGAHVTPGRGPEAGRKSNGAAWARNGKYEWFESRQRRAPMVTSTDFSPLPGVGGIHWLTQPLQREITPLLPPPVKLAGLLPARTLSMPDTAMRIEQIIPRWNREGRFQNPHQNEFITRSGLVIVRPRVILLGPPTAPIPAVLPQTLQSPAEVMSQLAEQMADRKRLAPAARHTPPRAPFSREALLERRGIALDAVSDLYEAVQFAVAHPENEEAQLLPGGLVLLGDALQIRLVHPKKNRALIVAVALNAGEVYRFVGRREDIRQLLDEAA